MIRRGPVREFGSKAALGCEGFLQKEFCLRNKGGGQALLGRLLLFEIEGAASRLDADKGAGSFRSALT